MEKDIKISIIVPVYNVKRYLKRCLNSLINQTLKDIEVICVNDGSPDNSLQILEEFAQKDKRIIVLNQENLGVSIARNTGLSHAKGKYIGFVDSDDWVDLDFFEKLYDAAKRNNCDIAIGNVVRKNEKALKYRLIYHEENIYETLQEKLDICDIPNCCYIWNKIYKSELIKDTKFKEGVLFEDVLWLPEVIKRSNKLITVPKIFYYYWVNNNSIVRSKSTPKRETDSYNAKKYIVEFFDENKLNLSKKERNVTKSIKYLLNIPIIKIKEYCNIETWYLFSFLPIYRCCVYGSGRKMFKFLCFKILYRNEKLSNTQIVENNRQYEEGKGTYPKVISRNETLKLLIDRDLSISRFGDGEFNLIFGEDLPFQKYSKDLANRLREILKNTNNKNIIAIPNIFGNLNDYTDEDAKFWRKMLVYCRKNIYKMLDFTKQYGDSLVSRPYLGFKDKNKTEEYFKDIKRLWQDKNIIIVEGDTTRLGYNNNLLENCKSIKRIICPVKNAFDKYDEILDVCKKQEKDSLFILALGPTATVLADDLSNLGFRALDMGHIDIEYEWFLQKATEKVVIKDKYVNENKKGRKITKLDDEEYQNQIIAKIL